MRAATSARLRKKRWARIPRRGIAARVHHRVHLAGIDREQRARRCPSSSAARIPAQVIPAPPWTAAVRAPSADTARSPRPSSRGTITPAARGSPSAPASTLVKAKRSDEVGSRGPAVRSSHSVSSKRRSGRWGPSVLALWDRDLDLADQSPAPARRSRWTAVLAAMSPGDSRGRPPPRGRGSPRRPSRKGPASRATSATRAPPGRELFGERPPEPPTRPGDQRTLSFESSLTASLRSTPRQAVANCCHHPALLYWQEVIGRAMPPDPSEPPRRQTSRPCAPRAGCRSSRSPRPAGRAARRPGPPSSPGGRKPDRLAVLVKARQPRLQVRVDELLAAPRQARAPHIPRVRAPGAPAR